MDEQVGKKILEDFKGNGTGVCSRIADIIDLNEYELNHLLGWQRDPNNPIFSTPGLGGAVFIANIIDRVKDACGISED